MNKLSRRSFSQFLGGSALAVGTVSSLGGCSVGSMVADPLNDNRNHNRNHNRDDISRNIEKATLAQYAYFIVPLLEPAHERYQQVAERVLAMTDQVPPLAALKDAGISALSATERGPWSKLSHQDREATVHQMANTPFFNFFRWSATETVLREPGLWQQLGYQGSSIEQGGYLNRGFDDIDWLPARKGKM
ncbi:MAG: hypothetical protein AB8B81_19085 [Halioglobus sp.]